MGNKWIIDVLADLKTFATQNELPILAEHLEMASLVAHAEIASTTSGTPATVSGDDVEAGKFSRAVRAGRGA